MPITVFAIVMFAAVVHASWNAIVKGAGDKLLTAILVSLSASMLAAITLPWLRQPDRASWPFILCSSIFQLIYYVLLARTYQVADMGQAYPLMRGSAPLVVALASVVVFGQTLSTRMWLGVGIICLGIFCMAAGVRGGDGKGVGLALLTAIVIACYTLIDGVGVRLSGAPAAYTLWEFLLPGLSLAGWALKWRRATFNRYFSRNWRLGLIGGAGTLVSYALALWAMTLAPVAVIAALRETSILFGTVISGLVLKERLGLSRIAAACIIAFGALVLRLA